MGAEGLQKNTGGVVIQFPAMNAKERLFGRVCGVDPRLVDDVPAAGGLSLRSRSSDALRFFTADNRLVSLVSGAHGREPDAIVVERIPELSRPLPPGNWSLREGTLTVPGIEPLDLRTAPAQPSDVLPSVRDYPGHVRTALNRALRKGDRVLELPVTELARGLKTSYAEAAEQPVLALAGRGEGPLPAGDMVLCGFLLTGRACETGTRLRADWHGRLAMEVRRVLHRTTPFAAAWLRFALEGRTSARQERLFDAMARDVETAADAAVDELMADPALPGAPFLAGVAAALDLVRSDLQPDAVSRYRII